MSPQPITVLVIGASRGIGRSLVLAFAESPDDQVIGSVRKPEDGEYGLPNASSIILNLKKPDSIAQAVQKTNTIDILVLNAGMGLAESILDLDEKEFQNYLDINVVGPWRVVKAFLPALQSGTEKKVVFTSSISGSMAANYEGKASVRGAYALTKVSCPNAHAISRSFPLVYQIAKPLGVIGGDQYVRTPATSGPGSGRLHCGADPPRMGEHCPLQS